jgi:potassium voltage-gated channel Eag-related subfamily H protein 7
VEIIFEGTTSIGERFKKNSIKHLSKGEYFGEGAFFTGCKRSFSVISGGFTKLFRIKRDDFLLLLN